MEEKTKREQELEARVTQLERRIADLERTSVLHGVEIAVLTDVVSALSSMQDSFQFSMGLIRAKVNTVLDELGIWG